MRIVNIIFKRTALLTNLILLSIIYPGNAFSAANPVPVSTKTVAQLAYYPKATAPAKIITENDSRMSSEVTAVIQSIPVDAGQVIEAGEPLVELEKQDFELELERAKANLRSLQASHGLAQRQHNRVKTLSSQQLISEEELGTRDTALKVSHSNVQVQKLTIRELERKLEKTVVRAPFKAIVIDRLAQVGELAMPGTPLIHILDSEAVLVSAKLQPKDVLSLQKASTITFVRNGKNYPVKIHRVTPALDPRERSQEITLEFTGDTALIGATGNLTWAHNTPHIPAELLVRRNNSLGVFILKKGKAHFVSLPDAEEGQPIATNLARDTKIIVDGRYSLQDGVKVSDSKH